MRSCRWLVIAVVGMLPATACSAPPQGVVDSDAVAGGETEPSAAPLTGLEVDDPAVAERPVVAVKIDNAAAARPQLGLELADVVFEELVEGGQTRFIALYHSQAPPEVGPVRSGREVDAELLPAFDPTLAMSGAAPAVWALLRAARLRVFEEGQAAGAFRRELSRRAPHNLMVSPARLWAAAEAAPAAQPWPIDARGPAGGDPADEVELVFSPQSRVTWRWDGQAWARDHNAALHVDGNGRPLRAETVVVARVTVGPGDRVDSGGYPTVAIDVTGQGEAVVLRDGESFAGRWEKASATDQFAWLDAAGDPLPVAPGRTWIELVPTDGQVTAARGGPDG